MGKSGESSGMNAIEKEQLQSNIWKFYLFDIFGGMLFAVPIMALFWQENGLNLTQIMLLQSLFSLAMVVLEVPTGYLADVYGRSRMLLISGICLTASISVYSIGTDFLSFLSAELLFALGLSLYSGTSSAFVYDTLVELHQENEYRRVWGRAKFYGLLAMAFSQIIGGFVGQLHLRWAFYLSIPSYLLLIPLALSFHEPKRHKLIVKKSHFQKLRTILKHILVKSTHLRWLIVFFAAVTALNSAGLWLYQPYLKLTGVEITYFGILFASFQLVAAVSSHSAHAIEAKLGARSSLLLFVPLIVLGYFLVTHVVFLYSFVFIYLFQFVRGFSEPVFSDYVNKLTTSDIRATVLSVESLFNRLLYAIIIPFLGWIADVYSITQAFAMAGIITLVGGGLLLLLLYRDPVL